MNSAKSLNNSLPIYVTRKTASGQTAEYSLTIWMTFLVMVLVWLNLVAWSVFGLYEVAHLALG